jgi:hypothetical protein
MRSWILGLLLSCVVAPAAAAPLRVLFIGNSYTYTHNLPEVFRRVAAAEGRQVSVQSLTAPGVSIEDHFSAGNLPRELRGDWDLVVMQQGPSSLPENRRYLVSWTAEVARHLDPARTRIVMFSVWPAIEHGHTWENAEISYAQAAEKVGGCLFPAAAAWRFALLDDPSVPLYSSDGLHPTREGVMLAAMSLSRALWPRSHKAVIATLGPQFRESAWQPAVRRQAEFERWAAQAVATSRPRCAD